MPVVMVYGLPSSEKELVKLLTPQIKMATALALQDITPDQVTVFFPSDLMPDDQGEEIVVFVKGVFDKPHRTPTVFAILAYALRDLIKNTVQRGIPNLPLDCQLVEVIVERFQPEKNGYAAWRKGE